MTHTFETMLQLIDVVARIDTLRSPEPIKSRLYALALGDQHPVSTIQAPTPDMPWNNPDTRMRDRVLAYITAHGSGTATEMRDAGVGTNAGAIRTCASGLVAKGIIKQRRLHIASAVGHATKPVDQFYKD
jgi:hypothetical protein